jgi:predicted transcriptional regulator
MIVARGKQPRNPKKEKQMTREKIVQLVAETILRIGKGRPNGHVYADMMGVVDFETYQALVAMLKKSGIVTESNYFFTPTAKGLEMLEKLMNLPLSEKKEVARE